MTLRREPGLAKAELHYRSARQYRELAQIVMSTSTNAVESDILAAGAGALLYECAKQCVDAVANLHGRDPKGNHEKMDEIYRVMADHPAYPDLLIGSTAAWYLHIHADQFDLPREEFDRNFAATTSFITEMLAIYESIRQSL